MSLSLIAAILLSTLAQDASGYRIVFNRLADGFCANATPSVPTPLNATFRSFAPISSPDVCATECAYSEACTVYQLGAGGQCLLGSACDLRQLWVQQTPGGSACTAAYYSKDRNSTWAGCQSQLDAVYENDDTPSHMGTPMYYTPVLGAGCYRIRAWGAHGGGQLSRTGGLGAYKEAAFTLSETDNLTIVVGRRGADQSTVDNGGGGGGGSFVYKNATDTPVLLLAAGGGGGAAQMTNGGNATDSENGTQSVSDATGVGYGGVGGQGAPQPTSVSTNNNHGLGGGGAGWLSDGWRFGGPNSGLDGRSRTGGWSGGVGKPANGGYGGGGGGGGKLGSQNGGGGGGGGYSGGGVDGIEPRGGGGGGSYAAPNLSRGARGGVGGAPGMGGRVKIEVIGTVNHTACTG
ncbi:hypothetical protein BOX15_Mlig019850g2 [Macrostomum lignano]|uniref:Apple domain-containing protein n=1 Tax=Macrostomum lignano TaxID=282301 RepID=A0A267H149_9PLAT|nr:hypothetical protein BOX15_Mlig019850g1 [Macrostomum lignano]PAA91998.1 hypothetical protein BOX15_Mlig019850g2 [Macrostomum lignano]